MPPRHGCGLRSSSHLFIQRGYFAWSPMIPDHRLKRLRYRAWHRGTREADMLIGGFFDRYGAGWGEAEADWFERFLEEQDVDIMAWAIGTAAPPEHYWGTLIEAMRSLDYIGHAK